MRADGRSVHAGAYAGTHIRALWHGPSQEILLVGLTSSSISRPPHAHLVGVGVGSGAGVVFAFAFAALAAAALAAAVGAFLDKR